MRFKPTAIDGLLILEPERHADNRGYFARTFCEHELKQAGITFPVLQASVSYNEKQGTLRGMHFQGAPKPEAKIVRCTRGAAYDVVIDLRKDSETYLQWAGLEMTHENGLAFYIPAGCAHGFITLKPETEMLYMMDMEYNASCAGGVRWNDTAFAIKWPAIPQVISDKDANWPDYVR